MSGEVSVVYDVEKMRPACALIQAAYGGTPGIASAFPSDTWLVNATDGMKLLRGTPEALARLAAVTAARHLTIAVADPSIERAVEPTP